MKPPSGQSPQARRWTRRRFLRTATGWTAGWQAATGHTLPPSNPPREAVLEGQAERIARHRMGTVTIVVRDWQGRLVPAAAVRIEQVRHAFLFGSNCFLWSQPAAPELERLYREYFARLFNAATLGFYWHTYESVRGAPRYAQTEEVLAWCREHKLVCKGHPLAWANLPDPAWLPDDPREIGELSLGRVTDIVGRFRGRIELWDVVNEPSLLLWEGTRHGVWAQAIGTQAYVSEHLRAARAADPDARLLVNEVLTAYPSYSVLDALRDRSGQPLFDAVGIQSHMHLGPWAPRYVWEVCERYARLGRPLHFTEFTVLSGERLPGRRWGPTRFEYEVMQGDAVPALYSLLFSHPAVEAVTWWDLSDRGAWKGAAGGLLRSDMSRKPAYERLEDLIKRQWWTRVRGETNPQGAFVFRAFYGRHQACVRHPAGREVRHEFECLREADNVVEIVIPDNGGATTLSPTPGFPLPSPDP